VEPIVVILNSFNRAALLEEALESLRTQLSPVLPWILVVFEAGSSDGSRQIIDRFAAQSGIATNVIEPGNGDASFAAGVNAAMSFALARYPAASFFLLFETDNCLKEGRAIADAAEVLRAHPELAAAGFTVRTHAGERAGYGCPFPSVWSFVLGQQLSAWLKLDQPKENWRRAGQVRWTPCDAVYTSPLLARREAWVKTGGLDAQAFPFADCDLDWAWRLAQAGFGQAVIQTEAIVHDNRRMLSAWSANRAVQFQQARRRLVSRIHGSIPPWAEPLILLRQSMELVFLALVPSPGGDYGARVRKRWLLLRQTLRGAG
jgi:GT2 family glycosyltransferase